ncbi:MAG TPA: FkbM family methyltransferase [Xanthobacteraceae bacterium]
MIAAKSFRFFLRYAADDPLRFAGMVRRRAVEHFAKPPTGHAIAHFGDVDYGIDLSVHRMMAKYFFQTHEMFLERIFDRYLRPDDVFIDVGANCGYWSAYALARVGRHGEVHAFEPVPHYFAFVQRLEELNPRFRVFANNVACGAAPGHAPMTIVPPRADNFDNYNTNIGSSSLRPGFLDHSAGLIETIDVEVTTLDRYVSERAIDPERIGLIKIDVEGFEAAVFDGMAALLAKRGRKVPILCEILTDVERSDPLDGRRIIDRLELSGYRCLDATDLKPVRRHALGFEENILCV